MTNKLSLLAIAAASTLALTACGGGGDGQQELCLLAHGCGKRRDVELAECGHVIVGCELCRLGPSC